MFETPLLTSLIISWLEDVFKSLTIYRLNNSLNSINNAWTSSLQSLNLSFRARFICLWQFTSFTDGECSVQRKSSNCLGTKALLRFMMLTTVHLISFSDINKHFCALNLSQVYALFLKVLPHCFNYEQRGDKF